jgi:prophage maintenance system killer protein
MSKDNQQTNSEIIIYKDANGPAVQVNFVDDTVWLNQAQMAELFGKDRDTISEHIQTIYKEAELSEKRTTRKFRVVRIEGNRRVERSIEFYNLDMIISVGYRVNSKQGTQFRIWATQRLRDYLLKGYAINKDRLKDENLAKVKELQTAISVIQNAIANKQLEGYEKEVLNIITDYASTWTMLYQYDQDKLQPDSETKKIVAALDYEKVNQAIGRLKTQLMKNRQASDLFGQEVGEKLKALLGNVEQTYDSRNLYTTLESKAAHLLYFAVKDHPFTDGNKRIGALLFMLYLIENHRIYNKKGERIINDSALTALTLLIAESRPEQKDIMVRLVASLIVKK